LRSTQVLLHDGRVRFVSGSLERSFEGQVAIITGGGGGIGRAVALRLARAGADIAIGDLDLASDARWDAELSAADVPGEVRALGRRSVGLAADLGERGNCRRLVDITLAELGRVDILVNAAGGAFTSPETSFASSTPDADMEALFRANYFSTVACCQAVAPQLRTQGSGAIVNFTSGGVVAPPTDGSLAHYLAAKAAVGLYTRSLAAELGPSGVRVNAVSPGIVHSPRVASLAVQRNMGTSEQAAHVPLGRFGKPDDVAKVIEFLVSDLSGYMTGQVVSVDGGSTLTAS
jgi:NAD(P)-dependent dehydrogenase (short-subunit alcohol dehydrogenase family)